MKRERERASLEHLLLEKYVLDVLCIRRQH